MGSLRITGTSRRWREESVSLTRPFYLGLRRGSSDDTQSANCHACDTGRMLPFGSSVGELLISLENQQFATHNHTNRPFLNLPLS